jgi:O-antigen/teichoic acid export membrane protein
MTAMAVIAMTFVRPPKTSLVAAQPRDLGRLVRDGAPYIVSNAATIANSEIDKTLLLRMLGPIPAGQYSAAFRVAQAATIPVNALVVALGPRLFRGSRHPDYFSKVILYVLIALLYGSVTAGAGWLIAPYAGWLFGADFNASTPMLRLLSLFIVSNCIRQVVTATLTGADQQWLRNAVEGSGMVFTIGANLVAIPLLGWKAAAGIAIVGDVLVITSGLSLLYYSRQRRPK